MKTIVARLHDSSNAAAEAAGGDKTLTKDALEAANLPHVQIQEAPMLVDSVDGDSGNPVGKKAKMVINNQWMNQRKIKSIKNKIKNHNKKKARRGGSGGLSSRKVKKSLKKK